jgi:hypothetical protein
LAAVSKAAWCLLLVWAVVSTSACSDSGADSPERPRAACEIADDLVRMGLSGVTGEPVESELAKLVDSPAVPPDLRSAAQLLLDRVRQNRPGGGQETLDVVEGFFAAHAKACGA